MLHLSRVSKENADDTADDTAEEDGDDATEEDMALLRKFYSFQGLSRLLQASKLEDAEFQALQRDVNALLALIIDGKFNSKYIHMFWSPHSVIQHLSV